MAKRKRWNDFNKANADYYFDTSDTERVLKHPRLANLSLSVDYVIEKTAEWWCCESSLVIDVELKMLEVYVAWKTVVTRFRGLWRHDILSEARKFVAERASWPTTSEIFSNEELKARYKAGEFRSTTEDNIKLEMYTMLLDCYDNKIALKKRFEQTECRSTPKKCEEIAA